VPESFHTTHVLEEDGKVRLDHLPFARGEAVEIFISTRSVKTVREFPLLGAVSKFENPTEPVALDDWAANQ
jgi:glycine cleavage system aminomethyltransferase T